jgi:hypothetical protein
VRLCARWTDYSRERTFPGGCFFYGVGAEFDARGGPVHDAVAAAHRDWTAYVRQTAEEARQAGDLVPGADAAQLAFEIIALLEAANLQSVMYGDATAYDRSGTGILARLRSVAVDPAAVPARLGG